MVSEFGEESKISVTKHVIIANKYMYVSEMMYHNKT